MQRLPNTPEGETKPIGFRLPPPMLAMIDREVDALRAASPEGASVTRSTALRALLVELEQRRAADPTSTPAPRLSRASLARIVAAVEGAGAELRGLLEEDGRTVGEAREVVAPQSRGGARVRADHPQVPRGVPVVHAAGDGRLSLLTRTANDGAEERSPEHRAANNASAADNAPASAEVLAALKPRLVAAHAAGHSAKAIGRTANVDPACITRWLKGTRAGVSVASAHKLGAYLASLGF